MSAVYSTLARLSALLSLPMLLLPSVAFASIWEEPPPAVPDIEASSIWEEPPPASPVSYSDTHGDDQVLELEVVWGAVYIPSSQNVCPGGVFDDECVND